MSRTAAPRPLMFFAFLLGHLPCGNYEVPSHFYQCFQKIHMSHADTHMSKRGEQVLPLVSFSYKGNPLKTKQNKTKTLADFPLSSQVAKTGSYVNTPVARELRKACLTLPAVLSGEARSAYRKEEARLVSRPLRMPGTSHSTNSQVLIPSFLYLFSYLWATDCDSWGRQCFSTLQINCSSIRIHNLLNVIQLVNA